MSEREESHPALSSEGFYRAQQSGNTATPLTCHTNGPKGRTGVEWVVTEVRKVV